MGIQGQVGLCPQATVAVVRNQLLAQAPASPGPSKG